MIRKSLFVALIAVLSLTALAGRVEAQVYQDRQGHLALGTGLGFTTSVGGETLFSLGAQGEYFFHKNISIVPRGSLGFDGDIVMLTATANLRGTFDLPPAELKRLKPFVQAGMGFNFTHFDVGPIDDSDFAFQLEFGLGGKYFVTDQLALQTEMNFMIPLEIFEDSFMFQWQVLGASYMF